MCFDVASGLFDAAARRSPQAFARSLSCSLFLSLSLSPRARVLSLSLYLSLSSACSLSLARALFLALSRSRSLALSLSLFRSPSIVAPNVACLIGKGHMNMTDTPLYPWYNYN